MTSVSKRAAEDEARYLGRSKLMTRAKSNTKGQEMKTFLPVGFSHTKQFVSKDAPAQQQQDASFYDSSKFTKTRFNEELAASRVGSAVGSKALFEPAVPPKYKNHAAGQPSDWAQTPIPG